MLASKFELPSMLKDILIFNFHEESSVLSAIIFFLNCGFVIQYVLNKCLFFSFLALILKEIKANVILWISTR